MTHRSAASLERRAISRASIQVTWLASPLSLGTALVISKSLDDDFMDDASIGR
ncbi:hypothetical protein BJX64DRAFT_248271 [Aspergillus heterothallicus]